MATIIILPKQGQSVESCIIAELKKRKGDSVRKGDVLFSYETDKAAFEEESPIDGIVLDVFYEEGDEVPVLTNMMLIGQPGEEISFTYPEKGKSEETKPDAQMIISTPKIATGRMSEETFISPRARNLAQKEALEVSNFSGSGAKGRIIEKDIISLLESRPKWTPLAKKMAMEEGLQFAGQGSGLGGAVKAGDLLPPATAVDELNYEDVKLSNMRKLIAKSMYESLRNSAQLTHHLGADARRILQLRRQVKMAMEEGKLSTNITLNDMVCFAVIKSLKKFPKVNSHFLGEDIRYFNKVHLALAVDTDRGLMVPVVRNADDLSITGLANRFKELASSCRKGNISPEFLSAEAASFTVSNLGNYGVESFTPVINLPQSAILGVNAIVPRPKDLGDGVYAFVPYIGLSLTYDHRALDGGEATRFVKQIAIELENLQLDIF